MPEEVDYPDSTVRFAVSEQYDASGLTAFVLGKNFRKEWHQPVKVLVFDIGWVEGAIKIERFEGRRQIVI